MKKYCVLVGLLILVLILFGTCKPNISPPTATISSTVVNNVVTFSLSTTNSTAYKWRFGDGDSAIVYSSGALTHTYAQDGTTYNVTLLVLGSGGQATATATVTIPVMTQMDKLTGGASYKNGKKWRISSKTGVKVATPDSILTVLRNYRTGVLSLLGLGQGYNDEYIFLSNGNFTISPQGRGILAGLSYCTVNGIANVQPQAADSVGLTYATPYTPPDGCTFNFNAGKSLTIATSANGIDTANVTYSNVNTLSFTNKGFIGILDFMSECIVLQLDPTQMTIAFFISSVPPQALQVGKVSKVWVFTFEVAP